MKKILIDSLKINELEANLRNISKDDKKDISDYTDEEILSEAKEVYCRVADECDYEYEIKKGYFHLQLKKIKNFINKYQGGK